jgi:hypothetical protein
MALISLKIAFFHLKRTLHFSFTVTPLNDGNFLLFIIYTIQGTVTERGSERKARDFIVPGHRRVSEVAFRRVSEVSEEHLCFECIGTKSLATII